MPPSRRLPSPKTPTPLLAWLLNAMAPMSRSSVKKLLASGTVQVNGESVTQFDQLIQPNDALTIGPVKSTLPILYDDPHYIVIDKPAGLLSVATEGEKDDTAFRKVAAMLPQRPFVVHRLDRETSGLLVFARTADARDRLQAAWESVEKTYLAIVEGEPPREGVIDNYLIEGRSLRVRECRESTPGAKRSISRYRVLRGGRTSLVEVVIETGRKHQIRVHLSGLGHPIIGDEIYGAVSDPAKRVGLHAHTLRCVHPLTKVPLQVESVLPAALQRVV